VKKSILVNKSNNTLTNTQAYGIGNTAVTGSSSFKNSEVKKSIVVNQSNNTLTNTQAYGIGNSAATGSIHAE
ncbi:MAG: hypothetical protein QNL62_06350, partial [Gammaproteobacteria bacterium]|nr:hypothetical protein [Gammaproteobacteria bacterium]